MEILLFEAFLIYFFYFLLIRKWSVADKLFDQNDFIRKLLKCSFCTAAWAITGLAFFGYAQYIDMVVVAPLVLFFDLLILKLM